MSLETLRRFRREILALASRHRARNVRVFGLDRASDDRKSREPSIPWKQIAGLRDKVIHEYFGVEPGNRMRRRREAVSGPDVRVCVLRGELFPERHSSWRTG